MRKGFHAAGLSVLLCIAMPVIGYLVTDENLAGDFPSSRAILWLNGLALAALAAAPILGKAAESFEFRSGVTSSFYLRSTASVLGLILTAVTDQMAWVVAYSAAVLFGTLMNWPKRKLWIDEQKN